MIDSTVSDMAVERHTGPALGILAPLVPSGVRPSLVNDDLAPYLRGVSVSFMGELFAMAIARLFPDERKAVLCMLFVRSEWRRKGLATSLLAALETWFVEEGMTTCTCWCDGNLRNREIVDHLLDRQGWKPARLGGLFARFNPRHSRRANHRRSRCKARRDARTRHH